MAKKDSPKASARGRRKSLVEEYKAKARGKKTSQVKAKPTKRKPMKKAPSTRVNYVPITSMEVSGETYSVGDVAHFVLEGSAYSKKPHTGEIKCCHPNDSICPSVTVWDQTDGKYRTIRAQLIGWDKAEAKKKWQEFVKDNPKAATGY